MIKTSEELGKAIKEQEEYGKIFDKTLSVNEIAELLKDQSIIFEIPDNIFQAGLTLTQPIYTFGKIGNAVKSVRSAVKMAEKSQE